MELKELQEKWPDWRISQTPGGAWVGKRKRHFMLTESRIDQGFRDCLIEDTPKKLDNQITKQEQLKSALSEKNGA